jgi:potassium-dependent mechanosensitive channel
MDRAVSNSGRRRCRRRCAVLLLAFGLLMAACQQTPAQNEADSTPPKSETGKRPPPPTPAAIALSEIPTEAAAAEAVAREIGSRLAPRPEVAQAEEQISLLGQRGERLLRQTAFSSSEEVRLVQLQDFDGELREMDVAASKLEATVAARARALDADLARLTAMGQRWTETVASTREAGAPESILTRESATAAAIEKLRGEVRARRDEALTELDRISRTRSALAAARADTADRRAQTQRRLFALAEAPLWRTAWAGRPIGQTARERLARDLERLKTYLRAGGPREAGLFWTVFLGSIVVLLGLRGAARECAKVDPFARAPIRLIRRPVAAALLMALTSRTWLAQPGAPILFYELVWVLAILSTAFLVGTLLGPTVRRTLYVLTAAACLVPLRYLYEQDPLLDRLVLLLQVSAVGAALASDLAAGRWKQAFPEPRWQRAATAAIVLALFLLSASFTLAVIGYIGTARLLRTGTIGSLGLALISVSGYALLYGFLSTLLVTRPARALRVVQTRAGEVRRFLRIALALLFTAEWGVWSLRSFGFQDQAGRLLQAFLNANLAIGSATISVSAILTFLAVLVATYLGVGFMRFWLEGEILPRLPLKAGLAFTISTTARYGILVGGLFLAFGAAGINLSRMTLLAGALGVGVGFGLQNLVNNFVSGLILLFERPVEVGDFVDVGSLVGYVRRIGMRSSTVQTAEGAEVIVPNADLISKSVINWTLSDRRRRIEVKVGVAYGSDPEKVIGLLLKAGADHPEALTDPAPAAYFMGFGDSSLDFVLHVWAGRFEQGLALQSAVRRAIHRLLTEAGIEIPFPQRDLNLKSVAPGVAEALRAAPAEEKAVEPARHAARPPD